MRYGQALSNNRAGRYKALGLLGLLFIIGCSTIIEVPAPKQFDCGLYIKNEEGNITAWHCKSRGTAKCIKNEYAVAEACSGIERTD